MLVIEVPSRRVLNNPLFLQVSIEGIDPTLRDSLPVLQETVVRADRDDIRATRAHAQFERGLQIRRPSLLCKNLHDFSCGDSRQRIGFFDNWTVTVLLTSLRGVDPVLLPPLQQRVWIGRPTEVQQWGFIVVVSFWEVCPGDVREWKSGCHLEKSLRGGRRQQGKTTSTTGPRTSSS
jgi:hypothetical protein